MQSARRTFCVAALFNSCQFIAYVLNNCFESIVRHILMQFHMSRFILKTYGYLVYAGDCCKCFLNMHNAVITHHTFNFQHLFHIVFSFIIQRQRLASACFLFFGLNHLSRSAFVITNTELKLIANAPIIGFSFSAKGIKNTPAATGIPIIL